MLMTGLPPEVYESMKKQTPLGYVAEPEELAGPVVFLASDHAPLHHRLDPQRVRRLPDVLSVRVPRRHSRRRRGLAKRSIPAETRYSVMKM